MVALFLNLFKDLQDGIVVGNASRIVVRAVGQARASARRLGRADFAQKDEMKVETRILISGGTASGKTTLLKQL